MAQTLYFTCKNDPSVSQILITARLLNKTLATQEINKKYDPVNLVTPHGVLSQPNTIMLYLAQGHLNGSSPQEELQGVQWLQFSNVELVPLLRELYGQIVKEKPADIKKYEYSRLELLRVLDVLNNHLKLKTFFVGDSLTTVDVGFACQLQTAFRRVISQENRKKIPHVSRWVQYVRNIPPFAEVLGPLQLCGKEPFRPATEEESTQKSA